jgi:hypothetical protein
MQLELNEYMTGDSLSTEQRAIAAELLGKAIFFEKLRGSERGIGSLKTQTFLSRPFKFSVLDVTAHAVLVERRRIIQTRGSRLPFKDYHIISRRRFGVVVQTVPRSVVSLCVQPSAEAGESIRAIRRHAVRARQATRREQERLARGKSTSARSPSSAATAPVPR